MGIPQLLEHQDSGLRAQSARDQEGRLHGAAFGGGHHLAIFRLGFPWCFYDISRGGVP